ncbi:MAG: adenosylcobinamide-GDP ribazoletransferase [Sphingomonadales bacterium]|nr:adenosylcobinamide-GDP ribazoletransferase [Sphingomonadales bacterium]MDE2167936.1 adenosylcobinamide-GDP ribazoletransferase [Sphingomonadales bacterium]
MSGWRARWSELQCAVMLLTRLPAGRLAGAVPGLAQAAWAFPLAGLLVGGIVAGVLAGALALGWNAGVAAALAMVAGLLATGALHEDGLADVADGFGGGHTRERKLEIMKDSRLGSYGAIALVMALGLRWMMLAQMGQARGHNAALAVIALAVASRGLLVAALAWMPAARADGLGRAAAGVGLWRLVVALGLAGEALALAFPPLTAMRVLAVMVAAVAALGWLARRQIGGQTGDVLGAMQVVGEITGWLVLALPWR